MSNGNDPLTPYERAARQEIIQWRDEKEGMLSRILGAATIPVRWIGKLIPERIARTLRRAVQGALLGLKSAAHWTYSESGILEEARKLGKDATSIDDLAQCELEVLDRIACTFFTSNRLAAAIEGGGMGLGGLVLVAADIPALFGIALRAIQQIGASYGFRVDSPQMEPIVLSILAAGSAGEVGAKAAALADMHIAAEMFAKGWAYRKVAERTATGAAAQTLKETAKRLPRKIAENVTRRKLAQAIPIAGAAIGAGFNYWFLSTTSLAAYMSFREMYLVRKYPGVA